nr:MAG TPA: hypothetical protein [Caudoviricetes sp.]
MRNDIGQRINRRTEKQDAGRNRPVSSQRTDHSSQ